MDRLQAMTIFVAVVDSGGLASAARKLDLSPPVVTRAVAELEGRLGLSLLTRTTRVVRVTDAGARFAEDCRRILADIDEAETAATGTHATPRGTLSPPDNKYSRALGARFAALSTKKYPTAPWLGMRRVSVSPRLSKWISAVSAWLALLRK
jgi:molybdenum-dependent DNA-binding transcriptional regulator ModE